MGDHRRRHVAIRWFLPEPGSDTVLRLLCAGDALLAPDIIRTEVAAAITRRVRTGGLSPADAKERYDCLYLSLARRTSSRYVTADQKFAEKASSIYPAAEFLGLSVGK